MALLKTLLITSEDITIHIPKEANFSFLKTDTIESVKKHLMTTKWFPKGLEIVEEDKEVDSSFDNRIYLERNIEILCYVGQSYPRYTENGEVYYGCWYLYEFGEWNNNINRYFNPNGTLKESISA